MKIKVDEPMEDFPIKKKMLRRKLGKLRKAKEDAREDLKLFSGPSKEELDELKKGLENTPLGGEDQKGWARDRGTEARAIVSSAIVRAFFVGKVFLSLPTHLGTLFVITPAQDGAPGMSRDSGFHRWPEWHS